MFAAAPASAQTGTGTGAFTESPNAALSRHLRSLAGNPKSVTALMGAGKAALELGDPQAALTFFARAEEQMPRDGRVKMWIASALVQLQQPHAALKFFRDAADLGVPAAELARDRGLAHDIAGNPREAQRDYRTALQKGRDDEATRRLALSLAISGEREPALRLLEDQLLLRDRSAERARALVLALTGDTAGATRAVQAAMPGPQAGAMTPFLQRLPSLAPADRALAVHLGVFPRDGRTAPPSTYAVNNYAVNNFAEAVTNAGRPDPAQGSLARRSPSPEADLTAPRRRTGTEERIASATPRGTVTPVPRTTASRPAGKSGPEQVAAAPAPRTTPSRPSASPGFGGVSPAWAWSRGLTPSQPRRESANTAKPVDLAPRRAEPRTEIAPPASVTSPALSGPRPETTTGAAGGSALAAAVRAENVQVAAATSAPAAAQARPEPAPTPVAEAVSTPPQQPQPQPQPAAEIAIAAAEPSAPPQPQPQPVEIAIAAAEPSAPPPQAEAVPAGNRLADLSAAIADIAEPDEPKPAPARAAAVKPKPAAAPARKSAAPADASRVWVQIAGGADKGSLPREYARLKAKAPRLLGGRGAWTAPLNASNRLLVGPFASGKEAQAFVNELKAQDLSGFAWTSAAGQKVEKLPAK
ncbi:MAG TPA: tetratricopeptide repeat protein [Allosphingosinicella sp.]